MDEAYIPPAPTHYPSQDERDAWSRGWSHGRQGRHMDETTFPQFWNAYGNGYWHGNATRVEHVRRGRA